jgi:hypothetical protein
MIARRHPLFMAETLSRRHMRAEPNLALSLPKVALMVISFIRSLRSLAKATGAGLSQYAILLGLISMGAMVALNLTGGSIREIFTDSSEAIVASKDGTPGNGGGGEGDPGNEDPGNGGGGEGDPENGTPPTVGLSASNSSVGFGESATFSWTSSGATTVSAKYTLSGACTRKTSIGSGPFALAWVGNSGSKNVAWISDLAGCSYSVTMTATNATGPATSSASVSIDVADTTPESLAFSDSVDVEPGLPVASSEATISGIDLPTTISVGDADAGVAVNGSSSFAGSQQVVSGDTVKLAAAAPAGWAATRLVPFTAGSASGNWKIVTRAQDTTPSAFSFATPSVKANALEFVTMDSGPLSGFDGPITASASGGALLSNDGASFSLNSITLMPGQHLYVKQMASDQDGDTPGSVSTTVTAGTATTTATVQTKDSIPTGLVFADASSPTVGTIVASNTASLTGFDGPLNLKVSSSDASVQFNLGGTWQNASAAGVTIPVNPNDTLQLRAATPAAGTSIAVTAAIYRSSGNNPTSTTWTLAGPPPPGKLVFSYIGSAQTFNVPAGVNTITVKVWGAGGGAGAASVALKGDGGAGGFASATINGVAGKSLSVYVAGGGRQGNVASQYGGSSGGGGSAITDGGTALVVAGGGGGGSYLSGAVVAGTGGGDSGTKGCGATSGNAMCGAPGTSSAPGSGGTGAVGGNAGVGHNGGAGFSGGYGSNTPGGWGFGIGGIGSGRNSGWGAGGGGGGWYGGGGGASNGDAAGSGGGGSGYINSGAGASGAFTMGSGRSAPQTSDPDYVSGVAMGGLGLVTPAGGDGLVVITW